MIVYAVIATNPQTDEKRWRYLVSEPEMRLREGDAEFEPIDVEPAVFEENRSRRSQPFKDWLIEAQWKAEGRLYQ